MVTVLGIDEQHNARAVEMKDGDREKIEKELKEGGWTNLVFLEK